MHARSRERRRASGAPASSISSIGRAVAALLAALVLAAVPLQYSHAATPAAGAVAAARRTTAYPGGAGLRWGHASVIADQMLYVFGGKQSEGNSMRDYAPGCLSLDLSSKFTTDNALWVSDCANKAPLLAGHTAVINKGLNMVILFGGAVPDDSSGPSSPLYLFSAEIKFWNTPSNADFPLALGNHSAAIDTATGDMIIHGGVFRDTSNLTNVVSNTTMHMVTMPDDHVSLVSSPTAVLIVVIPPAPQPAPSPSPKPTTSRAGVTITTRTVTTITTTASANATSTITATSTRSIAATEDGSTETRTSTRTRTTMSTNKHPTVASEPEPTQSSEGGLLGLPQGLLRKRGESAPVNSLLMTWTNATQPYGVAGRVGHTATILEQQGVMVVIGGFSEGKLVDMQTLFIYDTEQQVWRKRTASGQVPAPRRNHVATLVNNTGIVIHGGANADFSQALDDVAVLDTTTWAWQRPPVANAPAARYAHSAVQAGPYMMLMFGYVPASPLEAAPGDNGLYILDTTTWRFVTQFDPGTAHLSMMFTNQKLSGGTIFGLFVASLVALLVLLVLGYVGCAHYYNRHPRINDDENMTMLPTAELRDFGRRITMRLGVRGAPRNVARPAPARPQTRFLANRTNSSLGMPHAPRLSLTPTHDSIGDMLQDSRVASPEPVGSSEKPHSSIDGTRFSRRTHLDDVELPAGLRNRDAAPPVNAFAAATTAAAAGTDGALGPAGLLLAGNEPSRPTTSSSSALGPAHAAEAFLLNSSAPPAAHVLAARSSVGSNDRSALSDGLQPDPAVAHTDMPPVLRPWTADDGGSGLGRPTPGFAKPAAALRDSIDIGALLSQKQQFFVANPDDS
ncbi:hypothetical protein LPJ61_002099 [Coemansia biformis]|uniref:Galactose oxidase n=1 Tax=Coemansia biformis TaxID=1286918 RepID=A0A9W7YFM9_9FUNG|nr:hypothetical protein LPJ61_002099 [Coemansia biformis]